MKKYLLSVFTLVCASFMAWAAVNAAGDTTTFGSSGLSTYTENADGSYTIYLNNVADLTDANVFGNEPWNPQIPWKNANVKVTFNEGISDNDLKSNLWYFQTSGITDLSGLTASQATALQSYTDTWRFSNNGKGLIVPSSFATAPETFWNGFQSNQYGISGTKLTAAIYSNSHAEIASIASKMDPACTAVVVNGTASNDGLKNETTLNDINNNLPSTVTSLTISGRISDSQSTLTISNPNLTSLKFEDATNVNNIALDGLTNLETLDLNGISFKQNVTPSITFNNVNPDVDIKAESEALIAMLPADYQDNVSQPDPVEVTVAGSSLEANLLAALAEMEDNPAPKNVKRIHVTGTVTDADLEYLNTLKGIELIDFSEATVTAAKIKEKIALFDAPGTARMTVYPKSSPLSAETDLAFIYDRQSKCNSYPFGANNFAYYDAEGTLHAWTLANEDNFKCLGMLASLFEGENGAKSLYFDPVYAANGSFEYHNNGSSFTTANHLHEKFMTAVCSIPAENIDFTWENISEVGKDFSGLNPATHYIMIGQNRSGYSANEDFTNETAEGGYRYNENIYVVGTYKGTAAPYGTGAVYGGQFRNFSSNTGGFNQTANITYVRKAGTLGGAQDYVTDDQKAANKMIILGEMNSNDVQVMNFIGSEYVDFSQVTMVDGSDINEYSNENVKYLALPYNGTQASVLDFVDRFDQLLSVATFDKNTKTLIAHVNEANNLMKATHMIEDMYPSSVDEQGNWKMDYFAYNVENVVISGTISGVDIAIATDIPGGGGQALKATDLAAAQVASSGLNIALSGAPLKHIDLSNAVFTDNEDLAFAGAPYAGTLENIDLPTAASMTYIPEGCFSDCHYLDDLCIPYNYTKFEKHAFNNNYELDHIYTTNADGDIIDNGEHTYTLSENVTYIESEAFLINLKDDDSAGGHLLDNYISDVYVLATTAPICKKDAFDGKFTWGNNTFQGQWDHPVSRDIYYYRGQYIAVLHWPEGVDATNLDRYTDTHRDYTLVDETGATNGEGQVITWPRHGEFAQSFVNAQDSKYWDGETWAEADDYMGWHEFVLSNSSLFVEDELVPDVWDFSQYKDDDWWTICVPFDMTGQQIAQVFGAGTKVHKLVAVDRSWEENNGKIDYNNGKIIFDFATSIQDDASENVVIEAAYSYLIKPGLALASRENADGIVAGFRASLGETPEEYMPKAYDVSATSKNGLNDPNKHVHSYSFYGNFNVDAKRPANSYYLGLSNGKAAWKRDVNGTGNWKRFTAVIMDNVELTYNEPDATSATGAGFDNTTITFVAQNDDFGNQDLEDAGQPARDFGQGVNTTVMMDFGEGTETDAIHTVNGEDYVNVRFVGNVYNLRGEKVASNAEGIVNLPKGVYVANGKKFVVK